MTVSRHFVFLAVGATSALSATAACAQAVEAPKQNGAVLRAHLATTLAPPSAMPSDKATLDNWLAHKEYPKLSQRMRDVRTAPILISDMNWEREQVYKTGNFYVSYLYMQDLWRLGGNLPPQQGSNLKNQSAIMLLYTMTLSKVDGAKCADSTAPAARADKLNFSNTGHFAYLRSIPLQDRMALGTAALALEAATASVRPDDDIICSGGVDQTMRDLEANGGKPLKRVPNAPGTVGTTYEAPSSSGPKFLKPSVWRSRQEAVRRQMPAYLTGLLANPPTGNANPG